MTDAEREKTRLRECLRGLQRSEDVSARLLSDARIQERLLAQSFFREASTIFCFVGVGHEIRTNLIPEKAWQTGKRVAIPRCEPNRQMSVCVISSWDDLEEGSFGLLEPRRGLPILLPEEIDLAVVPCLACDSRGNRLGKGGGYYDRYLAGRKFAAAALCRESALLSRIPSESWDEAVDWVVTENRVMGAK